MPSIQLLSPLVVVVLASCATPGVPPPSFIAMAPPGAAATTVKSADAVEVLGKPPQRPARVVGIADYGAIVHPMADRGFVIGRLREIAARAGADALVFDDCIAHLGCVPRAVAIAFGGTQVLQASELPSLCYPPQPQPLGAEEDVQFWGPGGLQFSGIPVVSTECQFRTGAIAQAR